MIPASNEQLANALMGVAKVVDKNAKVTGFGLICASVAGLIHLKITRDLAKGAEEAFAIQREEIDDLRARLTNLEGTNE